MSRWPVVAFGEILTPNRRPYLLGDDEDANLVGMRLYALGPFHRELKPAGQIRKKSHFVIRQGDVIYNKLFAWKGTFWIVPPELDGMFVSDKFPTYALDDTRVDPSYLRWYFRYPEIWEQARRLSTGSAALSKLTLNPPRFLDLTIPLPPIEEQRRVVEKLNRLAAQVYSVQSRISSAETRAATFADACFGMWLADLAGDLGTPVQLGDVVVDTRYGTSQKCSDDADGIPVLRMGNIRRGRIDASGPKYLHRDAEELRQLTLHAGDILVCRTNSAELVGKCAVFELEGEWAFASYLIRLRLDVLRADPHYIAAFINSSLGRSYMFSSRKQMTGQANINTATLRGLPLPLPPLAQQQCVVARLRVLESELNRFRHISRVVKAQSDALLAAAQGRLHEGAADVGVSTCEESAR